MTLTERQIRNAKPRNKVYKLYDGDGLLLRVKPNGTKCWEYKYRINGAGKRIEKLLALGVYSDVSLKEAREKCRAAKKIRQEDKDPSEVRKTQKRISKFNAGNTFRGMAKEWYDTNVAKWTPGHGQRLWRRLELHILRSLGDLPITDISALDLLEVLRVTERDNKTETTHKLLQSCKAIFQYAVLTQRVKYNPAGDLNRVLKPHRGENYPTIGHNQLPLFIGKLEVAGTTDMNRLAIKMLMLTFVRQGELRRAKWVDVDLPGREWRIPAETTKMRQLHIVPLSMQAVKVLIRLSEISGQSEYVFPSQHKQKHPIMSENTINNVIHKMGYKGQLVGHGFRAMASTILNENGGFRPDVIERQLAHMPRDKVRAAYNRADYLPERRQMMEWWGEYIEQASDKGL